MSEKDMSEGKVWNAIGGDLALDSEDDETYKDESQQDENNDSLYLGHEESTPSSPETKTTTSVSKTTLGKPKTVIHELIQKQDLAGFDTLSAEVLDDAHIFEYKDGLARTPLHMCLLSGFPHMLEKLFDKAGDEACARMLLQKFRSKKDDLPPLHLALSMAPFGRRLKDAERCVQLVLDTAKKYEVDVVENKDGYGKEPLHHACDFGRASIVTQLLDAGANPMCRDNQDQMPIHFAIDSFDLETLKTILPLTDVQKEYTQFHPVLRCIRKGHWRAVQDFYDMKWLDDEETVSKIGAYALRHGVNQQWGNTFAKARLGEAIHVPALPKTVLITHQDCFNHLAIPEDCDDPNLRVKLIEQAVENPHRLEVITGQYGALRADEFINDGIMWKENSAECPLGDILRVHEYHYIYNLIGAIEKLAADGSRKFRWDTFDRSDTKVSKDSLQAARRAAGCVIESVDIVINSSVSTGGNNHPIRNVFCALRPPGHHAGPSGAVDPIDVTKDDTAGSQGFCLLNNVAIGAAYARCMYRNECQKIAIIDFDVHHGNGTEAICRNVYGRKAASVEESFMHNGGRLSFRAEGMPLAKPWLDTEGDKGNIFFASIHGHGKGFYPGSGADSHLMPPESPEIVNVALAPGTESRDLRRQFHLRIIPYLVKFDPDLIFISAGFDGHSNDLIGCCEYSDEDYVWMTQELMKVANRCCKGRIVSVLEGGYNTRAGVLSPFASCVRSHIRTLMHSSDKLTFEEGIQDESENEWNEQYIIKKPRNASRRRSRSRSKRGPDSEGPHTKVPKVEHTGDENVRQFSYTGAPRITTTTPNETASPLAKEDGSSEVEGGGEGEDFKGEPDVAPGDKKRPLTPKEEEDQKRLKVESCISNNLGEDRDSEMEEIFGTDENEGHLVEK